MTDGATRDLLMGATAKARFLPERAAQHDFLNSIIRSILQTACFTAIEILDNTADDLPSTDIPAIARQLLQPSDGDTERLLSTAAPLLCEGGVDINRGWFGRLGPNPSIRDRVTSWCSYRNNRIGHGVVALDVREEALSWLPQLAEDLVNALTPLLPEALQDGTTRLCVQSRGSAAYISIPSVRIEDGKPLVVRHIRQRGLCWSVKGQVLDPSHSPEIGFEFEDSGLTRIVQGATNRYRQEAVRLAGGADAEWKPMVLLPRRQTDTFEGRAVQLAELTTWLNDLDSKACNLYGDGGIGKTTLVLEALNRHLDGQAPEITWRPEVICFFSAKQTRWGADGLVYLKGIAPPIDDAVRALASVYEDANSKEWHAIAGGPLIAKAETLLRDLGLRREQILLVLDNTETLARSAEDEQRLGQAIADITRRLARVLITSRRRERMEALPIEVPPLNLEDSLRLVQRLATTYDALPVKQAGESGRRKLVTSLGGHPIKIDVCCRLIGRYGYSLERSKQVVLANSDLGQFLYEDAWSRLEIGPKRALVSLAQLGDSLPGELIQFVCGQLQVDQTIVLAALEETKFSVRFDYATQFDVRLEASALSFLRSAYEGLQTPDKLIVDEAVALASRRRAELLRAHAVDVTDRISDAFRTDAAKAAWQAASRGLNEDATFWYEEAIKVEPTNAQLLDRFAFFLAAKVRDLDRAALVAKEACRLDPSYPDAFFTAGHVAASLGSVSLADQMLDKAAALGMPPHRCELQKARARFRELENEQQRRNGRPLNLTKRITDAERHLRASSLASLGDDRDRKHQYEISQTLRRLRAFAKRYDVRMAT